MWYKIEVGPNTPLLDVSTAGSAFDTQLSVYRGNSCFNGWQCAGRNDDIQTGIQTSRVTLSRPTPGTYYVAVHGFGSVFGNFRLVAVCGASDTLPMAEALPARRTADQEAAAPSALWLALLGVAVALLVAAKVISVRYAQTVIPAAIDVELAPCPLPALPPVDLRCAQPLCTAAEPESPRVRSGAEAMKAGAPC